MIAFLSRFNHVLESILLLPFFVLQGGMTQACLKFTAHLLGNIAEALYLHKVDREDLIANCLDQATDTFITDICLT